MEIQDIPQETTVQPQSNSVGKIICYILKTIARILLVSVSVGMQGYFTYNFCFKYYMKTYDSSEKASLFWLLLVVFFQTMSGVSQVKLFFGNPGYVSDYFTSKKIPRKNEHGEIIQQQDSQEET